MERNGQDVVRKVSNGVACLQLYRLSSDSSLAVRVLGGFAVGLQDCEPQRGESVDFQPFLMASRQSVSVMYQRSLHMPCGRDPTRRIMEVDASVLLHSRSLAAAAMERMIDVRSAAATARAALLRPESDAPHTQTFNNIHNPLPPTWLRETERLFICGQSHGPCRTLLSCRYIDYCYCFTGHTRNTTALRHGNLHSTSSSARAHKPIRLGWYKENKGAQSFSPPQLVAGQSMYAPREATVTTCRPQRLALGASLEPAVSHTWRVSHIILHRWTRFVHGDHPRKSTPPVALPLPYAL